MRSLIGVMHVSMVSHPQVVVEVIEEARRRSGNCSLPEPGGAFSGFEAAGLNSRIRCQPAS